jgi:hypothetical protein
LLSGVITENGSQRSAEAVSEPAAAVPLLDRRGLLPPAPDLALQRVGTEAVSAPIISIIGWSFRGPA